MTNSSIIPESVIKHYTETRSLVTIKREELSECDLHGFILDYNDEWILVLREYDLRLDGLLVLRRSDVTSVNCTATNAFQRALMQDERVFTDSDFSYSFKDQDIKEFIKNIPNKTVVTVEDESVDIFLIGTSVGLGEDSEQEVTIELDFFSGIGKFDKERCSIHLDTVTSITLHSHYNKFYERYFERIEKENGIQ